MRVTDVQDLFIGWLNGPAGWMEDLTGLSIHVLTSALYVAGICVPAAFALEYGLTPTGLALMPAYVGVLVLRLADAMRMARRGPIPPGGQAAMPADRASPAGIAGRLLWTAVLLTGIVRLGLACAVGHPQLAPLSMLGYAACVFLAMHLHACSPTAGTGRAVRSPSPA